MEAQFYRAQRLESLGTLAGGIAHDLNNVLTPILTIAQLLRLQSAPLDGRSLEMLSILEDSARRGADMVRQILTFTRGTGGDRITLAVAPLLQALLAVVQQTFPKSIRICPVIPKAAGWAVSADPTYLHQVLMNLCVNARDAMPDGGVLTLTLAHRTVDEAFARQNLDAHPGDYVVIISGDHHQ